MRFKIRYDQGGPFRSTFSADYQNSKDTGTANTLLGTQADLPGPFAGSFHLPGTAFDPTGQTGFLFGGLYNFCIGATPTQIAARNAQALCGTRGTQFNPGFKLPNTASVNVDGNPANNLLPYDNRFLTGNKDTSYASGNDFSQLHDYGLGWTNEFQVTPNLLIKSISAYRRLIWNAGTDGDGSPLNILQLSFKEKQYQVSQELQIVGSALDHKLNYVVGGYYFEEGGGIHDYVTFDEGLLQVDGPNTLYTENHAGYGQVDYKPIKWLGFTLGGRYTAENKEFTGGQQDLNGFNYKLFGCGDAAGNVFPNQPFPLAPVITCQQGIGYPNPANPIQVYPGGSNHLTFTNFAPKGGVQIFPMDRVMIYATYSQGYKTGGWTTRFTNPEPTAADFGPETAKTVEVGAKTEFFDRRLQVNLAGFTTDYTGIQLNFQEGTSPTIRNAGNARINGGELQVVAAIVPGLTLDTSLGVLDAYYTSVLPGVEAVSGPSPIEAGTYKGAPLPKTPHFKINLSPRYEYDFRNGAALLFVGDYTHQASSWNDAQRSYLIKRAASDIINVGVTYTEPRGHWSIGVGGTNITNDRVLVTGNEDPSAGVVFGNYNRPAEWYLRLGVKL